MRNYWDDYPWHVAQRRLLKLSPSEMERVAWDWRTKFYPGNIIERTVDRFGIKAGLRGVVVEITQGETYHAAEFSFRLVRWTDGTRTTPNALLYEDTRVVGVVPSDFPLDELADFQEFELPPTP